MTGVTALLTAATALVLAMGMLLVVWRGKRP
jgi:hypothetical protein